LWKDTSIKEVGKILSIISKNPQNSLKELEKKYGITYEKKNIQVLNDLNYTFSIIHCFYLLLNHGLQKDNLQ